MDTSLSEACETIATLWCARLYSHVVFAWGYHYDSLSAMFTLLHNNANKEPFEKYVCNQSSHHEKIRMMPCTPVIVWNWSIHCPSLSAMFNLLHSSMNQKLIEKHLCNQGSYYERCGQFPLCEGSHHVQPPNQCCSLSAKMNGTPFKGGHWWIHCTYCGMPKSISQAEVMLISKKNQAYNLSHYWVSLIWRQLRLVFGWFYLVGHTYFLVVPTIDHYCGSW